MDPTTNGLTWSDEVYRIFGIEPQSEQITYTDFLEAVHPEDRDKVYGMYHSSVKEGKDTYEIEHRLIRPVTGEVRHVHEKCNHERDVSGQIVRSVGIVQDITESKKTLFELSKFKEAVDASADDIYVIDLNSMLFIDFNESALRNLGYTRAELLRMGPADIKPLLSKKELTKIFDEVITSVDKLRKIETVHQRKDGSLFDVEVHLRPFLHGHVQYLIASVVDNTEHKTLNEALRQQKDRLALAARAGGVGIWEWDIPTNTLIWDDQVYRLYGITRDTFEGAYESWAKCVHPDDIERSNDEVQLALSGKKEFDTEFRVIWPNSSIHYIRAIATVERDENGSALRLLGTNWDITDIKRTEEALQNSLKSIIDYQYAMDVSNVIALTDQKGIIKSINENFCKISKFSEEELLGQDHRIIKSEYHPKEFFEDLWATITSGNAWKGDIQNKAKDGSFYWVDTTIIPFLNQGGKPYQYLAIQHDITKRKKRAEEIHSLNQELEAFSYTVSHDLRAPLRALEGFANALGENYADKFDDEAKRWLTYITSNAKRMDLLINDILRFSRVSRETLKTTYVDMERLAKEIFEINKLNFASKNILFNLDKIPTVFGDEAMLRQVWQNLISNALKYSSRKDDITLTITFKINNGHVLYSVKDNGSGFDEKYIDKLFGVFQRLHDSEFEGTGVGLAIVKRIIQKHNGWITANSRQGEGAEFIFAIPEHIAA